MKKIIEKSWTSLNQFHFPKSPITPVTLPCGPGVKWSFKSPWNLTSLATLWIHRGAKWLPQLPTVCHMLCYVPVILCWTFEKAGSVALMLSGVDHYLIGETSHILRYRAIKFKCHIYLACVCAQSLQLCPTLCNFMDCSPPGSSVHGILQAKILEWVAMPSSRGSS